MARVGMCLRMSAIVPDNFYAFANCRYDALRMDIRHSCSMVVISSSALIRYH